jgi:hypothetical protein
VHASPNTIACPSCHQAKNNTPEPTCAYIHICMCLYAYSFMIYIYIYICTYTHKHDIQSCCHRRTSFNAYTHR